MVHKECKSCGPRKPDVQRFSALLSFLNFLVNRIVGVEMTDRIAEKLIEFIYVIWLQGVLAVISEGRTDFFNANAVVDKMSMWLKPSASVERLDLS